ncbi:glycoside hydrolase family 88 protein [Paenibacillus sp. strain BS8-2]
MLQLIAIIVLVAVIAVIFIDFMPIARDWLGRIHIGRYSSRSAWKVAVTDTGMKWLNRTPTIKVTDNNRMIVIDMLKGNYKRTTIQHWQEAALLLGFAEHMQLQGEDAGLKMRIEQYYSDTFDSGGQWKVKPQHVDVGILGYAIMKTAGESVDRFKPALDELWQLIQDHTGEDGTVKYRISMPQYRYVDTIGFICPFLIAYGTRYGKKECIELAVRQLEHYEQHGMLGKHYIPSHAYHITKLMPAGLYGWGRGLGWFAIGLIDAWSELPAEDVANKEKLAGMIKRFAKAVLSFQHASGSWNWSVNRDEARADSSATATLGWFLVRAADIEELQAACKEGAERAANYLMRVTRRGGEVDFSQGDTKDIGVYSMLFGILPFTQGFTIRLASAISR